ncbi:MAG: L-serine ammonia-lyase, iron-sulfur-dependent subunit beta [Clostridia bacterium]|nr:L-serine ammonia-lyase, iron-sulfur-dependent subunit beta [Clostridia bacterium]
MDLFDIIGPVMVGPSSSHTAGAARIGQVVLGLLGEKVAGAKIGFHGSFAKTYQGHGTDRAVVGGLMGMPVDDLRLRRSLELAQAAGLQFTFETVKLRGVHPNTLVIDAWGESGKRVSVQASSIGGGNIMVNSLNGLEVGFSGKENTLIIQHQDAPGAISSVSGLLAGWRLNIATMRVFRKKAGSEAVMAIELDDPLEPMMLRALEAVHGINTVTYLARRRG